MAALLPPRVSRTKLTWAGSDQHHPVRAARRSTSRPAPRLAPLALPRPVRVEDDLGPTVVAPVELRVPVRCLVEGQLACFAHRDDLAEVLVAEDPAGLHVRAALVHVEVRTADVGRDPHDGVRGALDARVGNVRDA